jgi:hypothetical protein
LKKHKSLFDEECSRFLDQRNGYRIQTKAMYIISTMSDVKLVYISGRKRTHIWKSKLMNLKITVRSKILRGMYRGKNYLGSVTSLELI